MYNISILITMNTFKRISLITLASLSLCASAKVVEDTPKYVPTEAIKKSQQDFSDAKLGIFIHWGIYSMYGRGEWFMTNENVDRHEYAKQADAFYPHRFDANEWAKVFKEAGAKYICFTSRHHDGFSMWDTKQSDYDIMNTPYGKDVLKSLAKACDKNDLKLHLYYSHIDWTREDYPAGRTGRGTGKNPANENWGQYYKFMNDQLTELLTNYGPIGAIWFDGWWDHDQDSVAFDWQLPEQYELIHRLQPSCLVANNHHQTPFEGEDIQIFERDVPGENHAGLSGQSISRLPLETCQTMNGMWGYKVTDTNYKSFNQLVQLLVKTASKGGNLLLNVGPQPNGELPAMAVTRLKELGQWLKVNGKAIYKTTAGNIKVGEHIVSTTGEEGTYLHLLSDTISTVEIPVSHKVKRVTTFPEGQRLKHTFKNGVLSFEVAIPKGCPDYIVEIK